MGRGRVDHPRRVGAHGVDEMRRFFRRFIRQAKDDNVDIAIELLLGGSVLARLGRQTEKLKAGEARELVPDLQAGGARFAVDEDFRRHDRLAVPKAEKTKSRSSANSRVFSVVAVGWAGRRS